LGGGRGCKLLGNKDQAVKIKKSSTFGKIPLRRESLEKVIGKKT